MNVRIVRIVRIVRVVRIVRIVRVVRNVLTNGARRSTVLRRPADQNEIVRVVIRIVDGSRVTPAVVRLHGRQDGALAERRIRTVSNLIDDAAIGANERETALIVDVFQIGITDHSTDV